MFRAVPETAAVDAALDEVRSLVQIDGGDLELLGITGPEVHLRLLVEDASCAECIMPRHFLQDIALDVFRRNGASDVTAVRIDDPRET